METQSSLFLSFRTDYICWEDVSLRYRFRFIGFMAKMMAHFSPKGVFQEGFLKASHDDFGRLLGHWPLN
jgi:hypothetical protein